MKISRMRPGMGDVPVISQLRALQDLKSMRPTQVAKDYRVTRMTVYMWKRYGIRVSGGAPLPRGFEYLVQAARVG